jgi:hypothetical protein
LEKTFNTLIISIFFSIAFYFNQYLHAQDSTSLLRAGLRSSTYGIYPFPDSTWWFNATSDMAARYPGTSPAVIWIVGYVNSNKCELNFPNPNPSTSYNNITFKNSDANEDYLDDFDQNGIKVWLQVEPGFANILDLIDLVLTRYGHHLSVIGFGVDVEWYKTSSANNDEGEAVTDAEAKAWSARLKSYNEKYLLFTKHWLISKMPTTFRTDIVFVDDSQIFPNLTSMINEFEDWGKAFAPAKVAFQYGYGSDKIWWNNLTDPPKNIGDEILKKCPNTSDLYWVDFTAYDIWPQGFQPTSVSGKKVGKVPVDFNLSQNYPNPFNPTTKISYVIPAGLLSGNNKSTVHTVLKVFDTLGNEIAILVNEEKTPGTYAITFDGSNLSSGVYFYQLTVESFLQTKKMILLR